MRWVLIAAGFFVGGLAAQAAAAWPAALKGRVVDATTMRALPGATVSIGDQRTVTAADGRFELSVPAGEWLVKATAPNYLDFEEKVVVGADDVRSLEILLVPRKPYEERVEVTAPRTVPDRPATIAVEPKSVLAAAGTADNIFHVLQTMPGVTATEDFGSRLSVRGGSPDQNLTIMDGVEIHNPYRLSGLTSAFNPETVQRFELTAGGFGAAYGDRLSSLLLVENRAGDATRRFKSSAALSMTDGNVVAEGRLPGGLRGSWIATGRRTYYDLIANRIVGTTLPSFSDMQIKGVWEPAPGNRVSLFALLSREAADAAFDGTTSGERFAIVSSSRNDVVSARYERQFGSRGTSTSIASWYRNTERLNFDGSFTIENRRPNTPDAPDVPLASLSVARDLTIKDVSARQEVSLRAPGGQVIETGFEIHELKTSVAWVATFDRELTDGSGSGGRGGGAGFPSAFDSWNPSTRAGAWLQDRIPAGARLMFEPGVRFDYSTFNAALAVSPRVAATWRLDAATRLRASGGLYVQSPGWEKMLQGDYFVDLTPGGSVNLANEQSMQGVVSLERDLSRAVLLRAEGYYKTYRDLIVGRLETEAERAARVAQYDFPADLQDSVPVDPIVTNYPTNDGSGYAYGFDVFVSRSAPAGRKGLTGWASYTFGIANRTAYSRRYPFDYDRRHALSLVGSYRFGAALDVAVTARVASGFPRTPALGVRVAATEDDRGRLVPELDEASGLLVYVVEAGGLENLNTARLPVFARVDARVTFRPGGAAGRWELYVDVINVLNRKNAGTISTQLQYNPASDRPKIVTVLGPAIPLLPSFGLRLRF